MRAAALFNLESERALIGAILIAPHRLAEIEALPAAEFYAPEHQAIWTAMLALGERGGTFDGVMLKHRMRDAGSLDPRAEEALRVAEETALSAANAEAYAGDVRGTALRRRLAEVAQQIAKLSQDGEIAPAAAFEDAERVLHAARGAGPASGGLVPFTEHMREAVVALAAMDKGELPGVPTGLRQIDLRLMGLQPGQLITLAARPGVGKSVLAMQIAEHAARQGIGAAVFNLEMPGRELALRSMASFAKVPQSKIKARQVSNYQMDQIARRAADAHAEPLFVDDTADLTIGEIRSRARRAKARLPSLGLVVVDYLQLVAGSKGKRHGTRQEEVAEVSRGLKLMAKELGVPVLALSQLSRGVEKDNRWPRLSDLKESGAIEQDSDVVLFIHRDGDAEPSDDDSGSIPCELIIAKQRNGESSRAIPLVFLGGYARFGERTFARPFGGRKDHGEEDAA